MMETKLIPFFISQRKGKERTGIKERSDEFTDINLETLPKYLEIFVWV
jgi:hypothetical protein